jgi:hypothetical protein
MIVATFSLLAGVVCLAQDAPKVPAKAVKPVVPLTDGLACSPFLWGADGPSRPEAKMLVPVTVDGKPYVYQLDTGSDEVSVYGSRPHPEWKPLAQGVRLTELQFAGMTLSAVVAYLLPAVPDADVQGVIGLDPLVGKVLVIDFPRRRVCLLERADAPPALVKAAQWSNAEVRHGKFFVRADVNGKRSNRMVYDTGASADALVMDLEPWKTATGLSDPKEATGRYTLQLAGGSMEYVTAPLTGSLTVGNRVYEHPVVATAPLRDREFTETYQADGVLGNALFHDSIVILDLTGHARFGVIFPAS